jgi:predicted alpha/beta-fold hydrolase
MPIIGHSSYVPPPFLANGHLQTLIPTLFRKVQGVRYQRERIVTSDDDFLDLDWAVNSSRRLAVIAHGLEGSSTRAYVLGMVKALGKKGWDAVVWNARGCSGEPNRVLRFTHSGATEDLDATLSHIAATRAYTEIALIGFSLGGNLTLKYVGERGPALNPLIKKAVALSVPCDLQSGSTKLAKPANQIYMRHFLISLRRKIQAQMKALPGRIDDRGYRQIRSFKAFDDRYTAPLHGFADAEDYWRQCSCKSLLKDISVPTLLINARNDPFLTESCYPSEAAQDNSNFYLETPVSGGHLGFITFNQGGEYWSETRALQFLEA